MCRKGKKSHENARAFHATCGLRKMVCLTPIVIQNCFFFLLQRAPDIWLFGMGISGVPFRFKAELSELRSHSLRWFEAEKIKSDKSCIRLGWYRTIPLKSWYKWSTEISKNAVQVCLFMPIFLCLVLIGNWHLVHPILIPQSVIKTAMKIRLRMQGAVNGHPFVITGEGDGKPYE